MARFYALIKRSEHAAFDPVRASELEVEWWRAHRENQHDGDTGAHEALVGALQAVAAYSYGVEPATMREAAELRAEAMDVSDRWIEAGCDPAHPLLREERALLVRSFAALLVAVHR
jgi:hypothetical protein